MATVARRRGHEVRLWGTSLDDALLDACMAGQPHPRLKLVLDGISIFRAASLAAALDGAELVIHAANSDGALHVMTKAAAYMPEVPVLSVTKGLLESPRTGQMERIGVTLAEHLRNLPSLPGPRQSDGNRAAGSHVDAVRRADGGCQVLRPRPRR
jgi:glycerol-3-phosphate dehydrogenase (NAD(P)+)